LKPLSAYNFFFRDERNRIIKYGPSYEWVSCWNSDELQYSRENQDALLGAYWKQDRTTKRKHRKSHGKISFTDLSKMVSKKWKGLTLEGKLFYQGVALRDRDRYQHQIMTQMRNSNLFIGTDES
jgi:HMG (high mobility group) box